MIGKACLQQGKNAHLSLALVVISQTSWVKHSLPKVPSLRIHGVVTTLCASCLRVRSASMHNALQVIRVHVLFALSLCRGELVLCQHMLLQVSDRVQICCFKC